MTRSRPNFTRWIFPRSLWILVTSPSLYNFKVMQYCHDVLGHEDVAGVQCHPHHRNQHRIEHGSLPGLQHVERSDQQVLVVEPGHLLPCSRQRHARHAPPEMWGRMWKAWAGRERPGTSEVGDIQANPYANPKT